MINNRPLCVESWIWSTGQLAGFFYSLKPASAFPRRSYQSFHVLKVCFQCALPLRREPIRCSRHPPFERLLTQNVFVFFELACVNAEITVRCSQKFFQLVECHRLTACQRADDSQTNGFVDDTVEFCCARLRRAIPQDLLPAGMMVLRFVGWSSPRASLRSPLRTGFAVPRNPPPCITVPIPREPGAPQCQVP